LGGSTRCILHPQNLGPASDRRASATISNHGYSGLIRCLKWKADRSRVLAYGQRLIIRRREIEIPELIEGWRVKRQRNALIEVLLCSESAIGRSEEVKLTPTNKIPGVADERQRSYLCARRDT